MFTNKAQIVQTTVSVVACLISFFAVTASFRQGGMSIQWAGFLFGSLLIVIALAIWGGIASADERDLEQQNRQISLLKTLCDSPDLPEQHVALVNERLKQETQNATDIIMGWRKRSRKFGRGAGFGAVTVSLLLIVAWFPRVFEVATNFMLAGGSALPRESLEAFLFSCIPLGVAGFFWRVVYRPIRDRAAEWFLRILRERNGEFPGLVPYAIE